VIGSAGRALLLCLSSSGLLGCSCEDRNTARADDAATQRSSASAQARSAEPMPELLFLPDGGDLAPATPPEQQLLPGPWGKPGRCGTDMVDVRGQFCIDRYEAVLVDRKQSREISPFYPPTRRLTKALRERWRRDAPLSAGALGRTLGVPEPPAWQLAEEFEPVAAVRADAVPNGYLSGVLAEQACRNAGKRLCKIEEWVLACRGEANRKFPYGDQYQDGRCNVFREAHPAAILHQDPSIHHLDPRLNLVRADGAPLLRRTGATAACRSTWGADGVHDMAGNLDEWVDDPEGTFVGGFYARGTREGCDARITSHALEYFDYSLGVRCCR
jgi:formylglycine-generating enzyme